MEHTEKEMKVKVKKIWKSTTEEKRKGKAWNVNLKDDLAKLDALKCPCIVQICDVFEDESDAYIVLEHCEKGDLGDLMKERKDAGRPFSDEVYFLSNILFTLFLFPSHRKRNAILR
jgi:serine/threonine protein kinase